MTGDIDSRASDVLDATRRPRRQRQRQRHGRRARGGAGLAAGAPATFAATIVFAGLSGEEQGLFGGQHMAQVARQEGWRIEAVLNNDMIGNIAGIDGVVDNTTSRVFSESPAATTTSRSCTRMRFSGGEVDSPSRQLARYVDRIADLYFPNLDAMMIYRLDRFGRGGHHRPFNDVGFPAVRIMEAHENYDRQHQDVRTEDGVALRRRDRGRGLRLRREAHGAERRDSRVPGLGAGAARGGDDRGRRPGRGHARWQPVDVRGWPATRSTGARRRRPPGTTRSGRNVDGQEMTGLVIDNYLFGVAAVGRTATRARWCSRRPGAEAPQNHEGGRAPLEMRSGPTPFVSARSVRPAELGGISRPDWPPGRPMPSTGRTGGTPVDAPGGASIAHSFFETGPGGRSRPRRPGGTGRLRPARRTG